MLQLAPCRIEVTLKVRSRSRYKLEKEPRHSSKSNYNFTLRSQGREFPTSISKAMHISHSQLTQTLLLFLKNIAEPNENEAFLATKIMLCQSDLILPGIDMLHHLADEDLLHEYRSPNLFMQPIAQCHDFSFVFKNEIDQRWRKGFLDKAKSGLPLGLCYPLAVGLIIMETHMMNIALAETSADTQGLFLIDTMFRQVRNFSPTLAPSQTARLDIKSFLNAGTSSRYEVNAIYV
ncbi:MAG: hypothetical protein EKK48_07930 [Candidatus Melainabacteria bacterium]|nr:MAG: hypothetical protein EKK48_07930 [Candidatus Melainabacteria bacterium]